MKSILLLLSVFAVYSLATSAKDQALSKWSEGLEQKMDSTEMELFKKIVEVEREASKSQLLTLKTIKGFNFRGLKCNSGASIIFQQYPKFKTLLSVKPSKERGSFCEINEIKFTENADFDQKMRPISIAVGSLKDLKDVSERQKVLED